jgi:hypothetical protein
MHSAIDASVFSARDGGEKQPAGILPASDDRVMTSRHAGRLGAAGAAYTNPKASHAMRTRLFPPARVVLVIHGPAMDS